MKGAYPFALAGVAWIAIGTWAEARRASLQEDNPALRAGIEADLASRYCPGLRIDPERFRSFGQAHGLSHEDFFMKRRSAGLKQSIAATTQRLRQTPGSACDRLWADYGTAGHAAQLLKRM
ncbi:hypothetical protein [Methylobacterium oxalidis]|uniref:Uncharacterized protein n=1 Tax=Methylobacterium oxalidis TaxID=944322 RepID=A0A512J942_9HYPH|nr:hypothetical protein [Methylobacterium oxalidis]GEP06487.1 hypothetical protein MOX02_45250 [Methylobacterium oxalidis]GJE33493.1 hypothetical protein LDDCCGHA_3693 [Methylobacterium oxalidis]GLS65527.1 hypothetical protein GCM10007888_39090 [Methylobacterium oxalidis]